MNGMDVGIVAGSLRFLESSRKIFYTVFHLSSMSAMSFCSLAWKEKVIKVVEVFTDQRVWRSAEEVKA